MDQPALCWGLYVHGLGLSLSQLLAWKGREGVTCARALTMGAAQAPRVDRGLHGNQLKGVWQRRPLRPTCAGSSARAALGVRTRSYGGRARATAYPPTGPAVTPHWRPRQCAGLSCTALAAIRATRWSCPGGEVLHPHSGCGVAAAPGSGCMLTWRPLPRRAGCLQWPTPPGWLSPAWRSGRSRRG
jgi:hypothetical protein